VSLLGDLLAQTRILATFGLLSGIAYILFLVVYRSRYKSRMVWIMQIELATYYIVMDALLLLQLYGVDATIVLGLVAWSLFFAMIATPIVFSVNKLRSSRRG